MKRNFTDEDIICFLYDEMDAEGSHAFLDVLCVDEDLWKRYEHFQEIVEGLSDLKYEPSQLSVEKVRAYVYKGQVPDGPVLEEVSPAKPKSSRFSSGRILSASVNINAVVLMAVLLFVSIAVTGTFLKLKRGLPEKNTPTAFLHDSKSHFQWDDSYLDASLDRIREKVRRLED
ncbi:MAG: hypothetical protein AAF696_10170 [Bacteroidota bacterium]